MAAGSSVVVKIGKHASVAGIGTYQIRNPLYQGSYRIAVESRSAVGVLFDRAHAMIATLFPVRVMTSLPITAEKNASFEPTIATTTTLTNTNGTLFKVTTPANVVSFSDEVQLNVAAFTKENIATIAPPPSGKTEIGVGYELNLTRILTDSTVSSFSNGATFDMYYADADIVGVDESTLKINKWSGTTWTPVSGSTLSASENRVSAQVSSFSMYAIIGDESSGSATSGGGSSSGGGGGGSTAASSKKGDVNGDGKVNLVDFSIMAYWYKRADPPASIDMNGDDKVDLKDFSIMASYWTR